MTQRQKHRLIGLAIVTAWLALFPGGARVLYPSAYMPPRRAARYVLRWTVIGFLLRFWLMPRLRARREQLERELADLAHDPSPG